MWTAPETDVDRRADNIPAAEGNVTRTGTQSPHHRSEMRPITETNVDDVGGFVTTPGWDWVTAGGRSCEYRGWLVPDLKPM